MSAYEIRDAKPDDREAMLALMPRLAEFEHPADRNPEHLWKDDAALLERWADGDADQCFIHVAVAPSGALLGLSMVTLRPELLSHEPSAHLEALLVVADAVGLGIGSDLIAAAEEGARARGARSMSLHVFECNERARRVYERWGYYGELIRYYKPL